MTPLLALRKSQPQGKPAAAGVTVRAAAAGRGGFAGGQGTPSRKQQLPHSLGRNIHATVTSKSACAARTPLASFVQPKRVS